MDPRATKHIPNRSQDISSSAQRIPDNGQARSSNLSGRVTEYYEKLVKNSPPSKLKTSSSSNANPSTSNRLQHTYAETQEHGGNRTTPPRHRDAAVRAFSATPTYPYTLYVEDPTGAFQRFHRRKSPPVTSAQHTSMQNEASNMKGFRPQSESPPKVEEAGCINCSSGNSCSCSPKTRVPAEQDAFTEGKSIAYHPSNLLESPQTDDEFPSNEKSFEVSTHLSSLSDSPKGSTVAQKCERDVIGQERSPVSKSQPSPSLALSTSSSSGDPAPRERKKWVRPPLVGQAASATDKSRVPSAAPNSEEGVLNAQLSASSRTGTKEQKSSYFDLSCGTAGAVPSPDEFFPIKNKETGATILPSEGEQGLSDSCGGGRVSPSSSVTSSRRLEWDSGADVGYNQDFNSIGKNCEPSGLCTIERMALAQGCSVALRLRLDPEGTTVPSSGGPGAGPVPAPVPPTPQQVKPTQLGIGKPSAASTPVERALMLPDQPKGQKNGHKIGISPIVNPQQKIKASGSGHVRNDKVCCTQVKVTDEINENPIQPVQRQWSNSLQDLRRFPGKSSEVHLFKSQSDPDLAGDSPAVALKCAKSKHSRGIHRGRNWLESNPAVHSLSSGSDATLVHVETEEDLCQPNDRGKCDYFEHEEIPTQHKKSSRLTEEGHEALSSLKGSAQVSVGQGDQFKLTSKLESHLSLNKVSLNNNDLKTCGESKSSCPPNHVPQAKSFSKKHICSDTDHRRGLHHHFGVLCSTVIGGHFQSTVLPNVGLQPENTMHAPERVHASVDEDADDNHLVGDEAPQDCEAVTVDSATSSALHSDAAHEDSIACGNTLTGRANSFEYLPGHVFESNSAGPGCSRFEQPPGISTSTETDSEPVRPISRDINHSTMADSSSHDTEEDRLWGSPRVGSNTLVQDLERGLNLLKGVMENKSAGRRCKREVIRRVIRKLVSSDYVEDMIEKERYRHRPHSPFSPRRTKYHDWQERHVRSKRSNNIERQEISGESDEPKLRVLNQRKKGHYQVPPASQQQKTHSILASGSKSSSLWSSKGDTTSGSISLSGSSDHQKTSKSSMKPNPLYKLGPTSVAAADWIQPATQSEIFQHHNQSADITRSSILSGVNEGNKPNEDPLRGCIPSDSNQQLLWVQSEINRLRNLKQLLQMKGAGKQSMDPNFLSSAITVMPITSVKQTMKMADCASPNSHSPRLSGQQLQQWATLESDTSAFCAQSGSSRDSQWQEIEIASAGEQAPHRTVSLSEVDETAVDGIASTSNRKSESPQDSCPQNIAKTRRKSVNISDVGQIVGTQRTFDLPKMRSDRTGELTDSRTYSSKAAVANVGNPHERVYPSEVCSADICRNCQDAGHYFSSMDSSTASRPTGFANVNPRRVAEDTACSCNPQKGLIVDSTGALKKSAFSTSSRSATLTDNQLVPQLAPQSVSRCVQTSDGPLRIRAHIDQDGNSLISSGDTQPTSVSRRIDVVNNNKNPVMRSGSDDSVTKAVTEAVSSKVRALRNLGHIEEAEVKIRVKMGQPADEATSGLGPSERVWKTQDIEEDRSSFLSKHTEMEEMIARQRALDQETRQKLLAIAEARQRSQSGESDTEHRIHDLLLRDYLKRQQWKSSSGDGTTQARLNIQIDTSDLQSRKTVGTSTARNMFENYSQTPELMRNSVGSNNDTCVCGSTFGRYAAHSQQPTQATRPQTAPASCRCSCKSAPTRPVRTVQPSLEKQLEFELQIRKQPNRPFESFDVHRTLRGRNKAYFLQFEEDETEPLEEVDPPPQRPPLEVVTVKVPKPKSSGTLSGPHVDSSKISAGKKMSIPPKNPQPSGKLKFFRNNKENAFQSSPKHSNEVDTVGTSMSLNNRRMDDDMERSLQSDTESRAVSAEKSLNGSRGKNISSVKRMESREMEGSLGKSSSEFEQGPSNILKLTPGRSHLSITVTESSMDSVQSPDGDSGTGSSSSNLPSRKVPRAHSPRRFDGHFRRRELKSDAGVKKSGGKVFRTMAFGVGTSMSASSSPSAGRRYRSAQGDRQATPDGGSVSDNIHDAEVDAFPSLQDYLERNYPEYLSAAEKRRRCIAEMAYLRRLRQQSRRRLLELEGDSLRAKQKHLRRARCMSRPRPVQKRRTPIKNIRAATARKCLYLPEVQQRLADMKRQEEHRANRLMAEIYTRKLQEKVLKGTATIRSSVSVISSL